MELNQQARAKLPRSHKSSHWSNCSVSLPCAYSMRDLLSRSRRTADGDHFLSGFSWVASVVCRPFAACRRHSVLNYWRLGLVKVAEGEITRLNTNDMIGDLDVVLARFSLKWIFDDVSKASSLMRYAWFTDKNLSIHTYVMGFSELSSLRASWRPPLQQQWLAHLLALEPVRHYWLKAYRERAGSQ